MALVEVEKGPSVDKYWTPEKVGDYVEGYLYGFVDGDYGKQIELYLDFDEDAKEYITQILPAHSDLKRTYVNLVEDAFTRVEIAEVIPPKSKTGYPKYIYKVLQDVEDKIEFPEKKDAKDSEYTPETVVDDSYYAE